MWPNLPKRSYIHRVSRHPFCHHLMVTSMDQQHHVFNNAEDQTVCFHSGLLFKPVWFPQLLGLPSNGLIFPWQADCQMWLTARPISLAMHLVALCDIWRWKMALMEIIWLFLVWICSLCPPLCGSLSTPHPIGVLVVLTTPVAKMVGNSASYPVYSRHSKLPWIAIDL